MGGCFILGQIERLSKNLDLGLKVVQLAVDVKIWKYLRATD